LINKYSSIQSIFSNEEKLIEKKINDALKKKTEKKCENDNINDNNENELVPDINTTPQQLYKDMKRAREMFDLIEKSNNQSQYWDSNINFNKVCEYSLRYNIDPKSIEKLWLNDIKITR
jgi:hypothetical protein